jgi:extracellular elastinolytic metalloproteinase
MLSRTTTFSFVIFLIFSFLILFFPAHISAQDRADIIRLIQQNPELSGKVALADLESAEITDDYTSGGIRHLFFRQRYQDIEVFNALLNVVILSDGRLLISGNRFIKDLPKQPDLMVINISPEAALAKAAEYLTIPAPEGLYRIEESEIKKMGVPVQLILSDGNISRENIPVRLVWLQNAAGKPELCWNLRIFEKNRENWWEIRVSAVSGEVLDKNNWITQCHFDTHEGSTGIEMAEILHPIPPIAGDYNVFPMPVESPNHGSNSIVNNPWAAAGPGNDATSLQWHHDGSNTYDYTRGNNVWAKDDIANDNETTIGYSPSSPSGDFNFPLNLSDPPANWIDAAITNLFFWNNTCHDVFYQYGFDEPSGNFQQDNQGRGGLGADYVFADARDGSGTNNANFSTPNDGSNPRMQMYFWNIQPVSVTALPIGTVFNPGLATFGPQTFNLTADLALADDGTGTTTDACEPLINGGTLAGKIALIDRGGCPFVNKVKNAQDAGAVGVIMVQNSAGVPTEMTGTDPTITIPTLMVTQSNGAVLIAAMLQGQVSVTMIREPVTTYDSDFDNGVITHEYGHGISNRLTGGPSNTACLGNGEQMGEGWSDYFALMLTTDWTTADKNDIRGIATYLRSQPITGTGIREYPYSWDMLISPYNYDYARTHPAVHALGSAWCSMLWDLTWRIIEMTPADPDMYLGLGGNNIALQLVMEGLKLQPCSPGFVDGRDAILLADQLLYNGAHQCAIWEAFARRGLGVDADQGSSAIVTDGVQGFAVPTLPTLVFSATPTIVLPQEPITFSTTLAGACESFDPGTLVFTLPTGMDYISGGTYDGNTRKISFPASINANSVYAASFAAALSPYSPIPTDHFYDFMESGMGSWNATQESGSAGFVLSGLNALSPSMSWNAQEPPTPSISTLTMVNPVSLPPGSAPFLIFYHTGQIENRYDGGYVEISTDGGANWTDLGPMMVENGYQATSIASDNPLFGGGVSIFTGAFPMTHTRVDLSSFAGQNIRIRFRFGTDTGNGGSSPLPGWFIDDILILENEAADQVVTADLKDDMNNIVDTRTLTIHPRYTQSLLPIELLDFTAIPVEKNVLTKWVTASETNNDYFTVERSGNGVTFSEIGKVFSAGSSTTMQSYQLLDANPLSGVSYYRLKQTDLNGSFTHSKIVAVSILENMTVSIYPNPFDQRITVRMQEADNGIPFLRLLDAFGKNTGVRMYNQDQQVILLTEQLPAGVYFLEFEMNGMTSYFKVVK